ncbi:MAG: hypothetical protein ACI37Q_06205 [Candidatus Gastranaerophilaceae bacterium]
MKKILLITCLILAVSPTGAYALDEDTAAAERELGIMSQELETEGFYRSPLNNKMPGAGEDTAFSNFNDYAFDYGRTYKEIDSKSMPFFKQVRLNVTNKINEIQYNKSKPKDNVNKTGLINKVQFWKKKKSEVALEQEEVLTEGSIANSIQNEITKELSPDTLSFETGINEEVTEKQLTLDCDNINFDEETGDIIATGRPSLYLPPQNIKVIADKMVYNEDSNILKGIGHVIVIKDGAPSLSDYIEIDMNEETLTADNVTSHSDSMIMDAENVVQKDSLLILTNGNFHSDVSEIHRLSSRMIGPRFSSMILEDTDKSLFFGDPSGNKLHFDIETLDVEARKNHDVFKAKHIEISRNGKHWLTWPSLTAYTNKERNYFEANYPEFGTKRKVGMFIGPGFVFGGPAGSVVKLIPFLNYQHNKFGFGGALKYRNTFNTTEFGYGSASDVFFLKGLQRLDDNLFLQYSANSFMDEWFMGSRMPKYMAEVFYDKSYVKEDFLAEGKNLRFRHRLGFGLMEDNDRNYYGEKINSNGTTTTRLRYMAEISQSIYSYSIPENRFFFDLGIALQGSAAVYGTGDTQFIARVGPRAHLQYKNWMQDIGYFQSGYADETPIPRYDMYRYGNSCLYLSEILRLNKYISVGWSGNINLSDDSPNGKMFQENRFVVALGPDDLKVRIGYDFVRRTTYFGFDVAFDTKGTSINYGKMTIKNPERLGKQEQKEERKLAFSPAKKNEEKSNEVKVFNKKQSSNAKREVLEYAQVIEIEDPDKETIQ